MDEQEQIQPQKPRRRWLRWILALVLLAIVISALVGGYAYRAAGHVPEWYVPADPVATSQQARTAEDKIADVQTWAASKHAYDAAASRGRTPIARRPSDELEISFTQGEVNSFLSKWYAVYGSQVVGGKRLSDVFKGPMVRIEKERITVAGAVPPLSDRVVSLDLFPKLVNGELQLDVLRARSGDLVLPEFSWGKPRQMLIDTLEAMALKFAPAAAFDKAGAANPPAISSVMAMQGVDSLLHRNTLNVMFLPIGSNDRAGLPVKLKHCELGDGVITFVTEPLDERQRAAVLYRLRGGKEPEKIPVYLTPSTRSTQ